MKQTKYLRPVFYRLSGLWIDERGTIHTFENRQARITLWDAETKQPHERITRYYVYFENELRAVQPLNEKSTVK